MHIANHNYCISRMYTHVLSYHLNLNKCISYLIVQKILEATLHKMANSERSKTKQQVTDTRKRTHTSSRDVIRALSYRRRSSGGLGRENQAFTYDNDRKFKWMT